MIMMMMMMMVMMMMMMVVMMMSKTLGNIVCCRSLCQQFAMLSLLTLLLSSHDNEIYAQQVPQDFKEYCQLEHFRASCPSDQVILIHSAVYGRMRLGRCVRKNYGSLGCSTDVMAHVDRLCSGRSTCQFQVAALHVVNSCPGDLTPFLEAKFTCVSVATSYDQKCLNSNPIVINVPSHPQTIHHPSTQIFTTSPPSRPSSHPPTTTNPTTPAPEVGPSPFLSSYIAATLARGNSDCPWQLKVQPGQQINFTLYNFGRVPPPTDWAAGGFVPSKPCHNLAVFRERQSNHVLTQCEGSARLVHAYLSQGNVVEVEFRLPKNSDIHFLLHYKATGCANPTMVHGATFRRSGEFGIMKCNATQEVHRLHCIDSKWRGMNCSWPSLPLSNVPQAGQADDFWGVAGLFSQESFPYSILLVVSIGVALGVFIGGVLLVCTTKFLKRRRGVNNNSLLQLHRHDYSITPQHQSINSPYPPHHLPPPHHHHHLHPDDSDSIYRRSDKLATEPCDVALTQLKNFPCSVADIQLQKLFHHHQPVHGDPPEYNEGDYFYAPRQNCRLATTSTVVAMSSNVACTTTAAFYGEVIQADSGAEEVKRPVARSHHCPGSVVGDCLMQSGPQTPTLTAPGGFVCGSAIASTKLKNCPIDFA